MFCLWKLFISGKINWVCRKMREYNNPQCCFDFGSGHGVKICVWASGFKRSKIWVIVELSHWVVLLLPVVPASTWCHLWLTLTLYFLTFYYTLLQLLQLSMPHNYLPYLPQPSLHTLLACKISKQNARTTVNTFFSALNALHPVCTAIQLNSILY